MRIILALTFLLCCIEISILILMYVHVAVSNSGAASVSDCDDRAIRGVQSSGTEDP